MVLSVWKNHLRDPSLNLTIIQRRNRRLETTSCWASEDSSSCNSNELTLLLFFSSGFLPSFYIFFYTRAWYEKLGEIQFSDFDYDSRWFEYQKRFLNEGGLNSRGFSVVHFPCRWGRRVNKQTKTIPKIKKNLFLYKSMIWKISKNRIV